MRELEERLRVIGEGLGEAVRREIRRLTQLGLPIYVADNGRVVDRSTGRPLERSKAAPSDSPAGDSLD